MSESGEAATQKRAPDAQPSREHAARRLMTAALVITIAGVALAGTESRTAGGVVVVAGWLALIYALHAFGRAST